MSIFSENLKKLRKERNFTQEELAKALNVTKSRINMYERGEREPKFEMLEVIADYFNVDMNFLLGKTNIRNSSFLECKKLPDNLIPLSKKSMKKVPLVGTIACGTPILAEQNITEYIDMDNDIHADFALKCKGDSMINARIFDGDIVYIKITNQVENGEIAAVLIDDIVSEATLKRFYNDEERIRLCAENPVYKDMVFYNEKMNNVHILGKAVAFLSAVR